MIGKKLARMIKKMTDQELYAFTTASILELERRSDKDESVEQIINSIYTVIHMIRRTRGDVG
ncbi:MAG: hypothetical protein J6Q07_00030 [Alistipes sp.]|nr:hypothetical protein [Alistipes sp.]